MQIHGTNQVRTLFEEGDDGIGGDFQRASIYFCESKQVNTTKTIKLPSLELGLTIGDLSDMGDPSWKWT